MCTGERKRQDTSAQVPRLLNGHSSMKERREEGGNDGSQPDSLAHKLLFHSAPAEGRTIARGGESPFSPQGGADEGGEAVGGQDKGTLLQMLQVHECTPSCTHVRREKKGEKLTLFEGSSPSAPF